MNIGDLLDLYDQGHLTEDYFHKAADWGAGLIRIPVSPGNFRKHGDEDSFNVLDKAVGFCERYGMYVIIDWHSEGDLIHNLFDKTYNGFITSREEMSAFWKEAASRYKDRPAVAFYEIFNEPHGFDNSLAWKDWRDFADGIIDQIYAVNPRAIPLVSGLAYASDLRDFRSFPLRNKGVALAVHIYPGTYMKSSTAAKLPPETNWTAAWGYLCKDYPIIITEFGFDRNDTIEPSSFKEDPSWGEKAVNFARERNISWTAFVFYKNKYWPMPLFSDWKTYKATEAGAFFKKELIGETSN
jgi:aryl-phospho-beta-D-glucosidase BglC (GH1 family)